MNFHGKLGLGKIPIFQSNQVQFIPYLMTPFSLVEMMSPVFRTVSVYLCLYYWQRALQHELRMPPLTFKLVCRNGKSSLQRSKAECGRSNETSGVTNVGTCFYSSSAEDFFPAVAYHFCLALPAAFTQPGAHLLAQPCR